MLQTLQGLWRELPGLIGDRIDLLTLEVQRAGKALMQIVALVIVAAILVVTAWLALWSAVVGLLMLWGLHWSVALLIVLALNLGAAWWAALRIRSLVPDLKLPATRRHLRTSPSPGPKEVAPPSPPPTAEPRPQPMSSYANNSDAASQPVAR
jgi:hypothetical protein